VATIRQRLVDQVAARIAVPGLTGVYIWRTTPLEQADLPAAVVRDLGCVSVIAATDVHEHRLTVEVTIFGADIGQVRELLGAVIATLRGNTRWHDGTQYLAFKTEPENDTLMTSQEERFIAGARLQFVVGYRTPFFDPNSVYP